MAMMRRAAERRRQRADSLAWVAESTREARAAAGQAVADSGRDARRAAGAAAPAARVGGPS
jgi:hypothetical protein